MAARFDIGGAIGTAAFGCLCGFAVAAVSLWPWHRKPSRHELAAAASASASAMAAAAAPQVKPPPAVKAAPEEDASAPVARNRPYNVLLVTVDTLRSDLGFAGYPKPITPNIDALAARSTVFERAYSLASFTPKSVGPLLIGRYASETNRDFEHYTTFYPTNVFLAERVRIAGVRTIAGMCHRYFTFKNGLQQGFDVWDTSAMPPRMTDNDKRVTSDRLTNVAIDLLSKKENAGGPKPFFAWFHYFDPHLPYVPHAGAPDLRALDSSKVAKARVPYDEEVWFTDREVGRLLAFVAAQPWAADTAIVLTADHGEAFGEHHHVGHGRELWEPLVRVPLIVYVPGAPPKRVKVKRSAIDLAPTIMDLSGAPIPSDRSLRGTSLVGDVRAEPGAALPERDVYIDMPEGPFNEMRRAFITGVSPGMKLVDVGGRKYELYDLANDPGEERNLAEDKTVLAPYVEGMQRLRGQLQESSVTR